MTEYARARHNARKPPEPVHILSLGAGVQSSTLALMAAHGEVTPMPMAAIFADTQAEPPSVYKWLDWLEKQLPFPVHRVTAGDLASRELQVIRSGRSGNLYRKSGIPLFTLAEDGTKGILPRKCTRDFKIDPITRFVRKLCGVKRGAKAVAVFQWIGISTDEFQRMKPSKYPFCEHRWPLIEKRISRNACLEWMNEKGYPVPPRSACVFCPYHSNKEWKRLLDDEPLEFKRAVEFERDLQDASNRSEVDVSIPFLHSSRKPLDQVDLRNDADHGQLNFLDECEGMCGV